MSGNESKESNCWSRSETQKQEDKKKNEEQVTVPLHERQAVATETHRQRDEEASSDGSEGVAEGGSETG